MGCVWASYAAIPSSQVASCASSGRHIQRSSLSLYECRSFMTFHKQLHFVFNPSHFAPPMRVSRPLLLQTSLIWAFGCCALIYQLQVAERNSVSEQAKRDLIGFTSEKVRIAVLNWLLDTFLWSGLAVRITTTHAASRCLDVGLLHAYCFSPDD